ncbi:hypothetical protein ACXO19_06460 [Lactobacillus delbrueckii subsp. bulgaricus]
MDCYTERLKPFLKRKIWRDTINSFSRNEKKWLAGYFIKPVKDKAFRLELMEKNNLSLTEQEGTQLGMALTTIMVNMTEHGRLTQEQLAQECKNILLQKNRRIMAEGDGRLGPGKLQELLAANNMSEEEFAAREFEMEISKFPREMDPVILATYAFARMKKLMEEEFPSFEDDDYAHMASVQITVLADMLQSGILSYNDLYQETLKVIEQLLG